jgi:hypothetical protein
LEVWLPQTDWRVVAAMKCWLVNVTREGRLEKSIDARPVKEAGRSRVEHPTDLPRLGVRRSLQVND